MTGPSEIEIERLSPDILADEIGAFAALLHTCVQQGASVGFLLPFELEAAEAFWRDRILPRRTAGHAVLWAARCRGSLAGTVQLNLDTMPNQPHRGEVTKLLVDPACRRLSVGGALMLALEDHASGIGRTLLTLETLTGSDAEPFYHSLGYSVVGAIPGYCRVGDGTQPGTATFFYKSL